MFRHLYLFSQQSHLSAPTDGWINLVICFIAPAVMGMQLTGDAGAINRAPTVKVVIELPMVLLGTFLVNVYYSMLLLD